MWEDGSPNDMGSMERTGESEVRGNIKEIRTIGRAGRPSAGWLAVLCVVGVLVVFAPSAWAAGTLYVSNIDAETVSAYAIAADGSLHAVAGSPFNAEVPLGVALTPDGKYLYVADYTLSGGVSAFSIAADGALAPVTGSPFPAKPGTNRVAIAPDGKHLYAANAGRDDISAYSIESNGSLSAVPGSPFAAGTGPIKSAITPNGQYLYVANEESNNVSAYSIAPDGALSALNGSPYPAGETPATVSLTPNGRYLYVAGHTSETITAFSIAADGTLTQVAGSPFPAPWDQLGIVVTPDGKHLYTASSGAHEPLSAFLIAEDGSLTAVGGSPFTAGGDHAKGAAVSPDGRHLFVSNTGEFEWEPGDGPTNSTVSVLSIASDGSLSALPGSPFATGYAPAELTVSPDQGPTATFSSTAEPSGDPTAFDATASSDPDFAPADYRWDFGDGQSETTSSATTTHTYAAAGAYTATLTVTDEAGCSTVQTFTGQTVSCNGSAKAETSRQVTVPTGVRLSVSAAGPGSGSVSSSPSGIACGPTCSYAFGEGETVKLTESPQPGSTFAGWSGACSGSEATCEVMMSEAREVKAVFNALPTFLLTVERTGTGAGIVTSEPSGIECEATCSHAFWEGEQVTLNAKPQAGSTFAGWSGGGCSGTGTCQVTTNDDTDVTVTFSKVSSAVPPPNETPTPPALKGPLPPLALEQTLPPSVQNARQSTTRWREGNQLAHIDRSKIPLGTIFSFSLNEQAIVTFGFTRLLPRGHSCLARTNEMQREGCDNTVTRGTLSFPGDGGSNRVVFTGRLSRTNKLEPGRYKTIITATNFTGQRSVPVSLSFTITR
jgi:DNA-binding beta-propeller fold protein YncE